MLGDPIFVRAKVKLLVNSVNESWFPGGTTWENSERGQTTVLGVVSWLTSRCAVVWKSGVWATTPDPSPHWDVSLEQKSECDETRRDEREVRSRDEGKSGRREEEDTRVAVSRGQVGEREREQETGLGPSNRRPSGSLSCQHWHQSVSASAGCKLAREIHHGRGHFGHLAPTPCRGPQAPDPIMEARENSSDTVHAQGTRGRPSTAVFAIFSTTLALVFYRFVQVLILL